MGDGGGDGGGGGGGGAGGGGVVVGVEVVGVKGRFVHPPSPRRTEVGPLWQLTFSH